MSKTIVQTSGAPAAIGPYSQAVSTGQLVFTAGQLGIDPASGTMADGIEAQTERALQNVQAILEAAGTSLDKVVKVTVFLADMADFKAMNGVYSGFFPDAPPARSAIQAAALPLPNALVEIEAVAMIE